MSNLFPLVGNVPKDENSIITSSLISWSDAKNMIAAYRGHSKKLESRYLKAGTLQTKILQGFSIDGSAMQNLLTAGADKIFISFGVVKESLGKPEKDQGFTLIIGGVKTNQQNKLCGELMLGDPTEDNEKKYVYEYCDPCPAICPKNFYTRLGHNSDEDLPCCDECS